MHKILIVGEHDGKNLNPATAKCVTCAALIPDGEITIVLLGADTAAVASQAAALAGVKSVLRVDRPENEHPLAAIFAPQLTAQSLGQKGIGQRVFRIAAGLLETGS